MSEAAEQPAIAPAAKPQVSTTPSEAAPVNQKERTFTSLGRRHYEQPARDWNFLTHNKTKESSHAKLTMSQAQGTRTTRFHTGFYRRSKDDIWPNAEQNKIDSTQHKLDKMNTHLTTRSRFLQRKSETYGDIVKGGDSITRPTFHTQRLHYPERDNSKKGYKRAESSLFRFYNPVDSHRHPNACPPQSSSVIGYGVKHIDSHGVLDNFRGHGYESPQRKSKAAA